MVKSNSALRRLAFANSKQKLIEIKGVTLLLAQIGNFEVRACFGVVTELALDLPVVALLINRYVRGIFSCWRKITLKESRPVYISAFGRGSKKSIHAIVTSVVCTVVESLTKKEIRVAQQTVIPPRLETSVLAMFTIAGQRLVDSEPIAR